MEKYVIGIDGGGTGSKGITADLKGRVLNRFRGSATNYNGGKKEDIDANMHALLEAACGDRDRAGCQAVCIGSAGVSNKDAVRFLKQAVLDMGYTCPVMITADSVTAHAGALNNQEGIILIAGTGAICFGKKDNGDTMRTGGYGHLIDDEGSAYDIARRMLRAVVRAADGRGEATVLKELIFERLQISSLEEMISWLYRKERTKKEIADLAVLIAKAQDAQDAAAQEILLQAAQALVEITAPVVEFFDGKALIALSGSVLKCNKTVQENYIESMRRLYPCAFGQSQGVRVKEAEHEADYGAVLLALDCAGIKITDVF